MKKIILLLSLALTLNTYTQVPSYVPTIGLVAWWPFNGNANDESGNGNNGTVNGATLTSDRFGNSNKAYLFNNDSLHLDSTNFALTQFSISAWFNTSTATANYASIFSHFVSSGVPNFTGYWIGLRGDSACFFLADGTTPGFDLKSSNTYNDGNWHLIAGTYSSGQAKLYVDGILQNSSNYFINLLPSVTEIGNNQYSEAFHGKIDDIGIWNRALTAQEVASIYSQNPGYIVTNDIVVCEGSSASLNAFAVNDFLETDIDGGQYNLLNIGNQTWMQTNLNVSSYRNGDPIPQVTDPNDWVNLTTGAWCWYNNDSAIYAATYGKLYNWYAVADPRGLALSGWHIPTGLDWDYLAVNIAGGNDSAGGQLKDTGTAFWSAPNIGATNSTGFRGLPGGYRANQNASGMFSSLGEEAWYFFDGDSLPGFKNLYFNNGSLNAVNLFGTYNYFSSVTGSSVRLVRDTFLSNTNAPSFLWSNGETSSTINVAPSQTTTYHCQITINNTVYLDSVIVTVISLPQVNAGSDHTICAGGSIILNGSGATTYSWNNGAQDGIAFVPNGNMSYVLTGTDSNGCIGTDSVSVNSLGSNTYIELYSNSDGSLCNGMAITQTNYSSNFTVIWSNGRTVTTTEAQDSCSNLCPGPFSVSITDNLNQCSFSLSGVVQNTLSGANPLAGYLNLTNADGNAPCNGEANIIAYGGVPPYQYQFMDVNRIISGSSNNADSLCPGIYTFKVIDSQQDSLNIAFLICDSSSIFSIVNPAYQDSLIVGTLIVSVMENCDIDFASVDSVWISSYSYLGTDSLLVSWNVQDSAGIHEILNYYNISNCEGVFNLELSIFCPQKSLDNTYLKAYDQLYINAQTASINSPRQEVLKVWPNPFTNELFIELTSNEVTDYFIMDAFGRVVFKGTLSPTEHKLDLHNLMNGIYFLCIGQKKIKVEKLLTSQD